MTTRRLTEHLPFGEKRDPRFFGQDILSVSQFNREDLETIFEVAHEMYGMVERIGTFDLLKGKVLTNLFYEPSTRTSHWCVMVPSKSPPDVVSTTRSPDPAKASTYHNSKD